MMLLTILLVSLVMIVSFKSFLSSYPGEVLASIFSANNYYWIYKNESYFEAMNSIKPLTNLWVLSMEMQFYILFYAIVYKFYKDKDKLKKMHAHKSAIICILLLFIIFVEVIVIKNIDIKKD